MAAARARPLSPPFFLLRATLPPPLTTPLDLPYTRAPAASASGSVGHCSGAASGTALWPPRARVDKKPWAPSSWAEAARGRSLLLRSCSGPSSRRRRGWSAGISPIPCRRQVERDGDGGKVTTVEKW